MNRKPYQYNYGDRQFAFPFLVGALAGGAAIGLTRPRPVIAVNPYPSGPYYGYNPNPYYGYGNYYYRPY